MAKNPFLELLKIFAIRIVEKLLSKSVFIPHSNQCMHITHDFRLLRLKHLSCNVLSLVRNLIFIVDAFKIIYALLWNAGTDLLS